jgi:hypothetical protein
VTGRPVDDGEGEGAITEVLETVEQAAGPERVSVGDILDEMGPRSFAPVMLIAALAVVSPISGIPGATSTGALIIGMVMVQMVLGRDHLWLPDWLKRRSIRADVMKKGVDFIRRPVRAIEPLIKPRLQFLTTRPGNLLPIVAGFCLVAVMPLMELVPTLGSLAAVALALFAAGFLTRDGVFIILGFAWIVAFLLLGSLLFG